MMARRIVLGLGVATTLLLGGCPGKAPVVEPEPVKVDDLDLESEVEELRSLSERIETAREETRKKIERQAEIISDLRSDLGRKSHELAIKEADRTRHLSKLENAMRDIKRLGRLQRSGRLERARATGKMEALRGELEIIEERILQLQLELGAAEGLSDEELFDLALQQDYRNVASLEKEYFTKAATVAQRMFDGEQPEPISADFAMRARERDKALEVDLVRSLDFNKLEENFEIGKRLAAAVFLAHIIEVEFPISDSDIDLLSKEEKYDLELLARSLDGVWDTTKNLRMAIDGFADRLAYRGVPSCVSQKLNLELSQRRAEAARRFLSSRLGGAERMDVDWYGNHSRIAYGTAGEGTDRRIEVRVFVYETECGRDSKPCSSSNNLANHPRGGKIFKLSGRFFSHASGRWVETTCLHAPVSLKIPSASELFRNTMAEANIDAFAFERMLFGTDTTRRLRLGNAFVFAASNEDQPGCYEVIPC